jgi:hypothetical protein
MSESSLEGATQELEHTVLVLVVVSVELSWLQEVVDGPMIVPSSRDDGKTFFGGMSRGFD